MKRPHAKPSDKPRKRFRAGLSLTELIAAVAMATIVMLAVGTVIADSVRGWQTMYHRVYSDVRDAGFVARRKFDGVIRNATRFKYQIDPAETWLEVYYHSNSTVSIVDRYARFYSANETLLIERGTWDDATGTKSALATEVVCENVASCIFKADGRSAQMILMLDNGTQSVEVVTSAVMHNGS
ncbi:MAG: hypothetical protein ACYS8Z_18175, partial [Planctomycetota bacterium]|jgi:hypothetical protein